MLKRFATNILLAGALTAAAAGLAAGEARADCPSVPDVSWWNATSHEAISQEVEARYRGDWALYQDSWQRFAGKLETLQREGAAVRIGTDGTVLRDESLRRHIGEVKRRISVIRCLARTHASTDPDVRYTTFQTASGPSAYNPATPRNLPSPTLQQTSGFGSLTVSTGEESALEPTTRISAAPEVKIVTRCEGTTTQFRITNLGDKWPGTAKFLVHRQGDDVLLSERRMRMGNGQTVSFNIQETSQSRGVLELRVVPAWAPEAHRSAIAKCT